MIAPDDDRRRYLAGSDQLIERRPGARPLAIAEPADPCRQSLEGHPLLGHGDPAMQSGIVREELQDGLVRPPDVRWVAAQGHPSEGAAALAELGSDERRHEPWIREGIRHAGLLRLRPQVVAVVEDDRPRALEVEHRPDVGGHGGLGSLLVDVGLRGTQDQRIGQRHLRRDVPAQRVMRGGLVGHEIEPFTGGRPRGLDLRRVPDQRDAHGLATGRRCARPREGLRIVVREPVHVADLQSATGARLVHLDGQADAIVHGHCQGLGTAHPAQTGGQRHGPAQGAAEVLAGRLGERLVGPLQDALGPDVDPRSRGHLAVHHQPSPLQLAEVLPVGPFPDEVRVGDEDPRCPFVGPQHADRLAALDQQGLVVGEDRQLADDGVERVPAARRSPGPAVDDEVIRVLRDLRIQVVHEHPEGGFLGPAATGQLGTSGGADGTGAGTGHDRQATPSGPR